MICINCTFHYSVWSFHLSFSYKLWNGWHQLICWFNVSWTLGFLEVVNVLPKFTSHVTSCGPPSCVFIQMYLFWLLFILLSLEGRSFSGVWVFVKSSVITIGSGSLLWLQLVDRHANASNSWYQIFHGIRLLMLTSLLHTSVSSAI